ncbi:hypothetical protein V6N13_065388 [Hibiscus sabdariffa]
MLSSTEGFIHPKAGSGMGATDIEASSTEGNPRLSVFTPHRFVPTQQRARNAIDIEGTQSFSRLPVLFLLNKLNLLQVHEKLKLKSKTIRMRRKSHYDFIHLDFL